MVNYICKTCNKSMPGYLFKDDTEVCRLCNQENAANVEDALRSLTEKHQQEVNNLQMKHAHDIQELKNKINELENLLSSSNNGKNLHQHQTVSSTSPVKFAAKVPIYPTTVRNDVYCLPQLQEKDEKEIRLVGDSIIRGQLNQFCKRNKNKRKRFCFPGANIDTLASSFDSFSKDDSPDTHYILHIGTNDISGPKRNPEILTKYRELIKKIKDRNRTVSCSAVLPRAKCSLALHNKTFNFNSQLASLCRELNIPLLNSWDNFIKPDHLYKEDGLHLSAVGDARFGRLLNSHVKDFSSKASGRSAT